MERTTITKMKPHNYFGIALYGIATIMGFISLAFYDDYIIALVWLVAQSVSALSWWEIGTQQKNETFS